MTADTTESDLPGAPAAPGSRRRGRRIAATLAVLLGLLVVGYAVTVYLVSGSDVPRGTTVQGVDIGGMSTEQAAQTLQEALGDEAAAPIPVAAGEASTELEPAASGLAVDWQATAAQGTGLILDPRQLLDHLRGQVELEPITTVDREALTAALAGLAETAASDPVEPRIRYTKQVTVKLTPGEPGRALDVPASADAVAAAYLALPYAPLQLPVTTTPPAVSDAEAQRVVDSLAEPAIAAPVRLEVTRAGDAGEAAELLDTVSIPPAAIAASLAFDVAGSTLQGSLNGEELHSELEDALAEAERPGRDAAVRIKGGKPVVVASKSGRAVAPAALADAVLPVLPETTAAARTATVALTIAQPEFTTADAKALNITEKLSSFRQWFPPAPYRYQNVGRAAELLNGTILEPGETFSMNDTIGERTAANGFTKGFIISGGRFREELGGGVSIITTATWTAGFYAGLERVEQHPHGLYISRYQAGLEATVAWGLLDLKMRNDTGNGVLITAQRFNDGVLIEMWGTKKFDKVTATFSDRFGYTDYQTITDDASTCVPSEGVRGFSITVTRRRFIDDEVVSKETWRTNYRPTPNVVCTAPGAGTL
ncbi:MAG TPA: VanW family protein [Candidatus Nanopelagicales bacterium]